MTSIGLALWLGPLGAASGQPLSSLGTSAPAWRQLELVDLEGRRWRASDLDGHVVLLDFWATWCAPCLAELPTLGRAWSRYRDEGLLLFGISMDRMERRRLESWLRRQRVDWPQIHDGRGFSGDLARRFGVETLPRSIVLDREGRVVAVDLRGEVLLTVLRDLLERSSDR